MENRDIITKKRHSSDGLRRRLVPFRASQTLAGYEGSTKRRQRRLTGLSARQQRIQKRKTTGLTDKIQARRCRRIGERYGIKLLSDDGAGRQIRDRQQMKPLSRIEKRFLKFYTAKKVAG